LVSDRVLTHERKPGVTAKTVGQKKYLDAIRRHDITFGVGPAGTGKTYLAVAMALTALREGKVSRIILTRPAVEAGEALGFLPGDLYEKITPYLRPLHDALHDMLPAEEIQKHTERGTIEIAPLAYMRGRTLNNAFIILDEAQNSTTEQMLMFLTRLGHGSKAVITGDETQIDLPPHKNSGPARSAPRVEKHRRHLDCGIGQARRRPPPARAAHHFGLRGASRPKIRRGGRCESPNVMGVVEFRPPIKMNASPSPTISAREKSTCGC
jgi:phosphate starvation-inducible PhoH-like protein